VVATATAAHWQHSAITMAVLPPGAIPEGTLEVARQLLHSPPCSHASPSVVEQWHHDIGQLVATAINMPPHRGRQANRLGGAPVPSVAHLRSPVAPRVPLAVRETSLTTADLRAELERCRSGEDDRITIEHQWDTTPMRQAACTPTSPAGSGGGCVVLAPYLRMVVWLCKFQPHLLEKYDGSVNPIEFLQIYSTSILIAGGNEAVMANYFLVALTGMAQLWLMKLPEGFRTSWAELCRQFTANFESAYALPRNEVDLHAMQQCLGESLRSFI
jgi:hypothetical protein